MPSMARLTDTHRPCATLAMALAAGIAVGKWAALPIWAWLIPATACLIAYAWWRAGVLLYAAVFFLGAVWMADQARLPPQSLAFLSNRERATITAVEGVADGTPVRQGTRWTCDVAVERVCSKERCRRATGHVQINVYTGGVPAYGDRCRIQGKLTPFLDIPGNNGFSYRRYMRERGTYWMMRVARPDQCAIMASAQGNPFISWALQVRRQTTGIFHQYLAPPEAGFAAALVLGEHNTMPKDLKQVFINTGTAHVLAISGMNMAVITAVSFFVLGAGSLRREVRYIGTIFILLMYVFISGFSPSVVRAGLMSSILLAAFAFEHEGEGLNSLGLAALILLAANPANLYDVGFQLSFAAVAAILIFGEPFKKIFQWMPGLIGVPTAVSLAAWLGTAPIIFHHFHMITPISVLANIPIVPLADTVMILGLGLAATGGWCPWLGHAFAGILKAVLSTMTICAGWFDGIPYGHFGP